MPGPGIEFTFEEVEEFGVPLYKLRPGDWFVTVSASDPGGIQPLGTFTGRLIYPGIGSALVELDRSFDSRIRWSPDTKVIPLPKPKTRIDRVSNDPSTFNSDTEELNNE